MNAFITFQHVLAAAAFAARAHRHQLRKDDKTPYVSHVFRVCLILRDRFGFDDPRMLCAALLHDALEDTTTDFDDIAKEFTPEVARWVALLTKDKRLAEDEREAAYIQALQAAPWQVQACKLADVYDNLNDIDTMPPEKRRRSLARTRHYLDGLGQAPPAEIQRALELTRQAWHARQTATS